ncbi:cobalt-precorrin-5B (C(1))-methyltransferase, partial [Mycobacterium tuberculosis]|nr:cobalt-precorrin-5B (C(1))-methyltransferase [Mycobacterium tuberculosis]
MHADPSPASPHLRRGWTTGTCAAGATRAALEGLVTGRFPATVPVRLPSGDRPESAAAVTRTGLESAAGGS